MENKKTVDTFGEAVSVLVQVANLAQAKGILSLQEAVIVAQALDRVDEFKQTVEAAHHERQVAQSATPTPPGPTHG